MTVKEGLLDSADTLTALSKRPSLHNMGPGRALVLEAKRLRQIAGVLSEDEADKELPVEHE